MKLEQRQIKELYDEFGSKHFQMQSRTLKEFGTLLIDIFYKSVGFIIQVLSIIGIIAGFGFTAYSYIQSKFLFFIGEGILFFTIIYGIIWIQKTYEREYTSVHNKMKEFSDFFERRNKQFIEKVYPDLINKKELNEDEFRKLHDIDNEMLLVFKPEPLKDAKYIKIYPKKLYYWLIGGAIILLLSFVIKSIIFFIICLFV